MNSVQLIGRLTKDIEVRYTASQMAVARFNVAINRGKNQNGEDKGADFPSVVVFGKQAENCEKWLSKGSRVAIEGRIQTGRYESQNGDRVYTTDVVASRVEFIDFGNQEKTPQEEPQESFQQIDEDIPF